MSELPISAGLSRKQALSLALISPQLLVVWEKRGLLPRQEAYSRRDVLLMRNLRTLRESKIPYSKFDVFVDSLHRRIGRVADPLHELRLRRHGRKLAVHWQGREMDAESGQLLLELGPSELKEILAFPKRNQAKLEDSRKQRASELFNQALERENRGSSPAEVISLYREVLELDGESFGAHLNLGTIYFNQGKLRLAENHYRRSIDIHPGYVLAHFNLASLYDEQGETEKALACYAKTIELDPSYQDAHYNLALLYQSHGRLMEAARHWKVFLKLDPVSEWASIARRELKRLIDSSVLPGSGVRAVGGGARGRDASGASGRR